MYLLDEDDRRLAEALEAKLDAERIAEEAEVLGRDLKEFLVEAWPIIEPGTPFIDGRHIDAICEHLQGVIDGAIRRLLITMPPGHMKSGICSVVFPAWVWCRHPHMRMLTASYDRGLSERDAMASKMIIESAWYQARWPTPIRRDTKAKRRFENSSRGYRVSTTVAGPATGEGGGLVIIDDPISMGDIHSPAKRAAAIRWLTHVIPTRIRNNSPGSIIMVGQRGHDGDPIGYALRQDIPGTVHLSLPARFDPRKRLSTPWFRDWRKRKGEPLWPEFYDETRLRLLEAQMDPTAIASQLQQEPTVDGGAIIKRAWWRLWTEWSLPPCCYYVISVDPAIKDAETNDKWAVSLWGVFEYTDVHPPRREEDEFGSLYASLTLNPEPGYHVILLSGWTDHVSYPEAKRRILQLRETWTYDDQPPDALVIEDKASGPLLLQELGRAGVSGLVPSNPGDKNKVARAHLVSDVWYAGKVWVATKRLKDGRRDAIVLPNWAEAIVAQCSLFPAGEHDDHVDAATQAIKHIREAGFIALDTDPRSRAASEAEDEPRRESAYGS